jgi:hypothetical protein
MREELADRWILGLRGSSVVSVSASRDLGRHEFVLVLNCGASIEIIGPAFLTYGAASSPSAVPLPEEDWQRLVGAVVVSAVAFKSGTLRTVFNTGHHLNVRGLRSDMIVHVHKSNEFDWLYQNGKGAMKIFDGHES